MKDNVIPSLPGAAPITSLRAALRADWRWVLGGSLLCFMLASLLMSGWPEGLLPNLLSPYAYSGDGLSHSWIAKRAIEGWIFENARSGYPFGSNFLDYPGADGGSLLVLKALGMLTPTYQAAVNLYFLLGFVATFIAAYGVLRACGIGRPLALAAAVLFDFLPFHFERLEHLFYTWYFVVPLFFYVALKIYHGVSSTARMDNPAQTSLWYAIGLMFLGSFGVYYAVFGLILFSVVAVAALAAGHNGAATLRRVALAGSLVVAGVLLNLAPNMSHQAEHGKNPEVAHRSAVDAETYGLKFAQLVMPRPDHRIGRVGAYASKYGANFPLQNENYTATLGLVGVAGIFAALLVLCAAAAGRRIERNLALVALATFVLFLFGTIGGLGSLFSQIISSSIRGWNRVSVFIAFGSLFVFFAVLQQLLYRRYGVQRLAAASAGTAAVLLAIGLFDQTAPGCQACRIQTRQGFELDRDFVAAIERALPAGSAVYQLPYMGFPEVPHRFGLGTYDLAAGYLHSDTLRWSYAGMKGREGDLFYRALADAPLARQIEVGRRLGFAGIYIDRRGYENNGQAIIGELTALLGKGPTLQRADGQVVFFPLGPVPEATARAVAAAATPAALMQLAGFSVDRLGTRYEATLAQCIDFTRRDVPMFVRDLAGLSGPEPWGRWSDANLAPAVRIVLDKPVSGSRTLKLTAQPFGPNEGKELLVQVGTRSLRIPLRPGVNEYVQALELGAENANRIEITAPQPVSPQELNMSGDTRKIGVGLIRLAIE